MASNDKGAGPQVGQVVLYNNGGVIVSAIIYAVATNGTVSLVFFGTATPATSATGVAYDVNLGTSKWAYTPFF